MSGAASRRRGADAERAVVAFLRSNGYPDARRYLAGDGRQPGDIDAIPGVVIEVKDHAHSRWPTWVRQAQEQAGPERVWCVVRRLRGVRDVADWPTSFGYGIDGPATSNTTFGRFLEHLEGGNAA